MLIAVSVRSCCWGYGFESRLGHGSSCLVFVMCCVGSGFATSCSDEFYRLCVCVCVCVCVSNCV